MRSGAFTNLLPDGPDGFSSLVAQKHREYCRKTRRYAVLFYGTRLAAGLSAAALPFFVRNSPNVSTFFAVVIALATVVDSLFSPKERMALFSKATDLLAYAHLKATAQNKKWEEAWKIIENTEAANLRQLPDLQEILDRIRVEGSSQSFGPPNGK